MSGLERRLQLLLDAARYERVAGEAERSGRSVASVIREAIDLRFPGDDDARRAEAAAELLELTATPGEGDGEGPDEIVEAYAAELESRLHFP